LTQSLGWFSIALGAAELLAPQAVARVIGIDEEEHTTLLRTYGLREMTAGIGILTRPKPTYWMWNRVIGDAVDLVSLGKAMRSPDSDKTRLAAATIAVLGVTALDIACSVALTSERNPAAGHDEGSFMLPEKVDGALPVIATVTVNKPVEEVYRFWKNPENFSRFMDQIESVRITSGGRARWKVKAPAGLMVEWDTDLVTDTPNEMISWRSLAGAEIENKGTVRFRKASGDRGTEVELEVDFKPKGGPVGEKIAKIFLALPKTQVMNDLRRFKQIIEIGEIVKSDASAVKGMHPARPPKYSELED
ncbi:MAG TPA: SRPBCC family protein, partial [Gemmatimonadaceae bacterium]|nr:SRPBCC family protein [Gemmatimonadaceae bacterium]